MKGSALQAAWYDYLTAPAGSEQEEFLEELLTHCNESGVTDDDDVISYSLFIMERNNAN